MTNKAGDMHSFNKSKRDSNNAISVFLLRVFLSFIIDETNVTSVVIPQLTFIKECLFKSRSTFLFKFAVRILNLEKL